MSSVRDRIPGIAFALLIMALELPCHLTIQVEGEAQTKLKN
jgi:hypothetical protein